jgi:hypothetical protein
VIPTVADGDGQALKKALVGDFEEASMVSTETVSQVEDPVDAWVLSSPVVDDRIPSFPRPMVLDTGVAVEEGPQQEVLGGDGGVSQEVDEIPVREVAPVPTAKADPCVLPQSRLAAAKGKRTKTVVVETSGLDRTTRKSARNRGAAATPVEKAQQRAAECNLEKGNPFTVTPSLILIFVCCLR